MQFGNEKVLPICPGQHVMDNEISNEEILTAVKGLKAGKEAGMDRIQNEFIKHGGDDMLVSLKLLFNRVLDTKVIPEGWKISKTTFWFEVVNVFTKTLFIKLNKT